MRPTFLLFTALLLVGPHTHTSSQETLTASTLLPGFISGSGQPGRFELEVDWEDQEIFIIESSFDLENWQYEILWESGSIYPDTTPSAPQKFYRARASALRVAGTVRNIVTETPLAEATVSLSSGDSVISTTNTDAQGNFQLIFLPSGYPAGRFELLIQKTGFEPITISRGYSPPTFDFSLALDLLPLNYPPNDDFQNRTTLEGSDITFEVTTLGAWMEPRHFLRIGYDDYSVLYPQDVWYTWTAPADGALVIQPTEPQGSPGVIVYTGESLQQLVRVWDSSDFQEQGFFVREGVDYQIAIGADRALDIAFTLKMIPPVPAGISWQPWPGNELIELSDTYMVGQSFFVSVRPGGTKPLSYQWRKDGVDIPGATNTFFSARDVTIADGGNYSVRVSNQAGAAMSEDLHITVQEPPHLPELMRGSWTQETMWGQVIVTFTDTEFAAKWAADDSFAGSGHYRLMESSRYSNNYDNYDLRMSYTELFPGDVDDYYLIFITPAEARYSGTIKHPEGSNTVVSGTFTRLAPP